MVRDCPRHRRGAPPQGPQAPQGSQAMVSTLVATPPAPPARGGGQAGRGHPRGGGQACCYAFPGRTDAFALAIVITSIVPVCHRDTSILFDPGSTYLYASSYFASYFDISRDALSALVYVSTPVRDSIMVDRVYQSCLVDSKRFPFIWSDECEESFQKLKTALTTVSIMVLPSVSGSYTVYCDALRIGVRCVLMQEGRVIAYTLCQLKSHEKNYPVNDLELATIVHVLKIRRQWKRLELLKWERITMDFVVGLPRTLRKFDAVWVIVDKLTKSAHFIPVMTTYSLEQLARIYIHEIVRLHSVPVSIISNRGTQFTSYFWRAV
ncbi:uncharacterized protein [Nicotiana tomentosiformis]|uniref:uncharacterized protein n=1 Tax=Nicotiana tomentosiformis TaxID=4098 RepID=UPI00388C903A